MWKENLYQPVEVLTRRHTKFPIDEHQHSFYEMVYVRRGRGDFYVREEGCKVQETLYKAGSLFLIPPDTVHCFTIESLSEYVFIRFTARYADDYLGKQVGQALQASVGQCAIHLDGRDARTADALFGFIDAENAEPRELSSPLIRSWLNSLLLLVAGHCLRGLDPGHPLVATQPEKALCMLQYIQQQIHHPDRLTGAALGEVFHLAPSYVGAYFKSHFQEDLRHYIQRNRMRSAEHLLIESSLTVKEIAIRTGYVDSSHLIRLFERFHAMTPQEFRKRNRLHRKSSRDSIKTDMQNESDRDPNR